MTHLKSHNLQLNADWHFQEDGPRQHYVIEPSLDGCRVGRAYGWYEAGDCFVLEKIEVDRGSRSRGVGTAVIDALRKKAREKHCREFRIQGVRAANPRAAALYESMGAIAVQTSPSLRDFVIAPP